MHSSGIKKHVYHDPILDHDPAESYDGEQKLLSIILHDILREGANRDQDALAWIFDDPMPGHKFRVPFEAFCEFVKLDGSILTYGIEKQAGIIRGAPRRARVINGRTKT